MTCFERGIGAASVLIFLATTLFAQPTQLNQKADLQAEVEVGGFTLFVVHTRLGPFSASDRAEAANRKLARLVKEVLVSPEAMVADEHEASTDIVAGDLIVTTVTEADAKAGGTSRAALANSYVTQMRSAITKARAEYTYKNLLLGALYATLTTLVFLSLLFAMRWFSPRLYGAIERWRGTRIRSVKIQSRLWEAEIPNLTQRGQEPWVNCVVFAIEIARRRIEEDCPHSLMELKALLTEWEHTSIYEEASNDSESVKGIDFGISLVIDRVQQCLRRPIPRKPSTSTNGCKPPADSKGGLSG